MTVTALAFEAPIANPAAVDLSNPPLAYKAPVTVVAGVIVTPVALVPPRVRTAAVERSTPPLA